MAVIIRPKFPKPDSRPRLVTIYQCGSCPYFISTTRKCEQLGSEVDDRGVDARCPLEIAMITKVQE